MWNPLNRVPRTQSPEQSTELEETSNEVLALLTSRARAIAETAGMPADEISSADIEQAAYAVALQAERKGVPFTEADFAEEGAVDSRIIDMMDARMSARPTGSSPLHVMDSTGAHIRDVQTKSEAAEVIGTVRESGERSTT